MYSPIRYRSNCHPNRGTLLNHLSALRHHRQTCSTSLHRLHRLPNPCHQCNPVFSHSDEVDPRAKRTMPIYRPCQFLHQYPRPHLPSLLLGLSYKSQVIETRSNPLRQLRAWMLSDFLLLLVLKDRPLLDLAIHSVRPKSHSGRLHGLDVACRVPLDLGIRSARLHRPRKPRRMWTGLELPVSRSRRLPLLLLPLLAGKRAATRPATTISNLDILQSRPFLLAMRPPLFPARISSHLSPHLHRTSPAHPCWAI